MVISLFFINPLNKKKHTQNNLKMHNIMTDFKKYLQILSPEKQIYERDSMIHNFNKSIQIDETIN